MSGVLQHSSVALKGMVRSFVDLLYPPLCPLCMERLNIHEQMICDPCRARMLPEHTWRCKRCGATGFSEGPRSTEACPKCPPAGEFYQGVLASVNYNPLAARCVHRFKYERRVEMGEVLADVMVARLAEPLLVLEDRIGWIVPVPLHWRRRMWRGFNQSDILARRLSQAIELPVVNALRRTRFTKMQTRIPKSRRAKNVAGAFSLANGLPDALPGILLVDDVVTTSHTASECAKVLMAAGAPQVWVACFARA